MTERVVVYMPRLGHTTGEMPHLRRPPKNWLPGQNLYYLHTACRNLGYETTVVDANWHRSPVEATLALAPAVVLISSATPTFSDALAAAAALQEGGLCGQIFIGGPHVSLNSDTRQWLLPSMENVTYVPIVASGSTFHWVPRVFAGRSSLEVLGLPEGEAKEQLTERIAARGKTIRPTDEELHTQLFASFRPTMELMEQTYHGPHVLPQMRQVPIRYSMITSIGCDNGCSFCGNPFIYTTAFKSIEVVRQIVGEFKARGVTRLSLADMHFLMNLPHAQTVMGVLREEGVSFLVQTCLENLTNKRLAELREAGVQKFLVGIENPMSEGLDKRVDMKKLYWLLDATRSEGPRVKLSYIVGLPDVPLRWDLALLRHVARDVAGRGHPLEDLQVNLFTPYRPDPGVTYLPYEERSGAQGASRASVKVLTRVPFCFWGCFPVGITCETDFERQMILADLIYLVVYEEFAPVYGELRAAFLEQVHGAYPVLQRYTPSLERSRRVYSGFCGSATSSAAAGHAGGGSSVSFGLTAHDTKPARPGPTTEIES